MTRRLIVLDRDGVINWDSKNYIKSPAEWRPLPGSITAVARLAAIGFDVVVCTNQSGLARGLLSLDDLSAIHARMDAAVRVAGGRLAAVFICPHGPDDGCACRKPQPGLLRAVEQYFGASLCNRPVVGDSARDLVAASRVGARPMLVRTGNGEQTLADAATNVTETYRNLATLAEHLIEETKQGHGA